jgi:hypothetical protein
MSCIQRGQTDYPASVFHYSHLSRCSAVLMMSPNRWTTEVQGQFKGSEYLNPDESLKSSESRTDRSTLTPLILRHHQVQATCFSNREAFSE